MSKTATREKEEAVVGARKTSKPVIRKNGHWWQGAREPEESSSLQLAKTRPDWGGDYLIFWIGKKDGEELIRRGFGLFQLESIKKRTVTLSIHKTEGAERRWGLHKIRLANKALRPHIHFPVEDGKYRIVDSKEDQNEIELRMEGDRITFELPPSIR
jgi:hypothetical protein